ncbi:MAG: epoxyqueuosine reductase [Desulfobacterales bacterium]|nr:epoxyqueuosine reductase [Desulfobacterales bacterium]
MPDSSPAPAAWLTGWMRAEKIALWGAADLRGFATPPDETGAGFPRALAFAIPMDPHIMAGIRNGPTLKYADEYARVNGRINEVSLALAAEIKARGFRARPLAASSRTDPVAIMGDFPHKTAATRAGLGWIGRHCQLITRPFGSWVRLGTVFTDLEPATGPPVERGFCGECTRIPREELLDVHACDRWKKEHYFQFHKGHNCGICSAVCPYGLRQLKKR